MLNGCYSIARQALAFNWLDRIFDPDSLTLLGLHIHSTTYLKYVKCWRLNLVNFVWDSSFIQQLEFLYYRLSAWISTNTPLVYLRPTTLNVILNRYFIYRLFVMNYDLNVPVCGFLLVSRCAPYPTSGAGWQRWNRADIDLNSRRKPLRNFKYESSSSPGRPPGQEEFRPWALSASPSGREATRMADERPPI